STDRREAIFCLSSTRTTGARPAYRKALTMETIESIALRQAAVADASVLAMHRRSMFRDMGYLDDAALDSMMVKFRPWLEAKMDSREYLAWLAVTSDDCIVAGAGLWLMDWPAHMLGHSARRRNILNVYTEPEYRRRGLARAIIVGGTRLSQS